MIPIVIFCMADQTRNRTVLGDEITVKVFSTKYGASELIDFVLSQGGKKEC